MATVGRKYEPWVNVLGRLSSGSELTMPFYFVGTYSVTGGNTLNQPDILGLRQPTFKTGIKAQTHELTAVAYGWGDSVGGYRDILQRLDNDPRSIVALVFPNQRSVIAPLVVEQWSFRELEYGIGTGEPVKAEVNLTLKTL